MKQETKKSFDNETFRDEDFTKINLFGGKIYGATFINCDFSKAYLVRTRFQNCVFENCIFSGAIQEEGSGSGCQLLNCKFNVKRFEEVNFYKTHFFKVDFRDSVLWNVIMADTKGEHTNFGEAKRLKFKQGNGTDSVVIYSKNKPINTNKITILKEGLFLGCYKIPKEEITNHNYGKANVKSFIYSDKEINTMIEMVVEMLKGLGVDYFKEVK